jgi:hypothetical protein
VGIELDARVHCSLDLDNYAAPTMNILPPTAKLAPVIEVSKDNRSATEYDGADYRDTTYGACPNTAR